MQLTVFGATGMVGKHIIKEALAQGHTVTAFGRNIEQLIDADLSNDNLVAIKGYVFDEESVYKAIEGRDAILSVLGGSFDGLDKTRSLGIKNIVGQMEKAGVNRIVALGGLGVLDAGDGTMLLDKPGYPAQYLPVGREHMQAYEYLKESNLDWTMVAAPDIIDGKGTSHYITSPDVPPTPNTGKINAGNLALFMISEATKKEFVKHRVGISNSV